MSQITRMYPGAKPKMTVSPIQWLPGALSAMLPFFAASSTLVDGRLYFRSDDPNLYGIIYNGGQQNPVVEINNVKRPANKGRNFYSAPWCIPTLPARDLGQRIEITSLDDSIYNYISALYTLIGTVSIQLTDWRFEQSGYVKLYQIVQGSQYLNSNGTTYFGGQLEKNTAINGVGTLQPTVSYLITNDFTFNGSTFISYQMPYNTFYVVDSPIVISAIDANSNDPGKRIYFTLQNTVTVCNGFFN